jgi:nucleoside-diphosphate-sugar epimerase
VKIFITGASGFIGGAIAQHLSTHHEILAMARSQSAEKKVESLGVKSVKADLETINPENLSGCDVVIHCAAYAEEWGTEADFFNGNVKGTENLLRASRAASVKRFIFIGTEAALFHGQDMLSIDENYPYAEDSPYPYSRTKAAAEKLVLQANSQGFVTLSIRPRLVWGPGDRTVLPAILKMIENKKFAWIGHGAYQTSTTHIKNLIQAVELALGKGLGGNAYFVADEEVSSMKDFLSRLIQTQGVNPPEKNIPKVVARLAAHLLESIWKIFLKGKKPPIVRFSVDIMSSHCTLNIEKAKRELEFRPVITVIEGLRSMPHLESK